MTAHEEHAHALYTARQDRRPIAPLSESVPGLSVDDAYEIQGALVNRMLQDGGSIIGYKLGLTSKPMQEMLGVDEPDYGPVLSSITMEDGYGFDLSSFIEPRIEAEIALVLKKPLSGPGVTTVDVARAVDGAVASLEIVDSRIEDWRIKLVDTIADLASCANVVLGSRIVAIDDFDVRYVGMVLRRNGHLEGTGAGAAALGGPLEAVAWLANTLGPYGVTLQEGHVILTGALSKAIPVAPGDRIRADFDRLGSVACQFS